MGRGMTQVDKTTSETRKNFQELRSNRSRLMADISFLSKRIEEFEKATKELGIDPNDSRVYKDSVKSLEEAEKLRDDIK